MCTSTTTMSVTSPHSTPRSRRATRSRSCRRSPEADRAVAVAKSVLDLIGNTPMVDVSQLSPNPNVRFVVKLEGRNPAGSVKDRVALSLVEQAEADGVLKP